MCADRSCRAISAEPGASNPVSRVSASSCRRRSSSPASAAMLGSTTGSSPSIRWDQAPSRPKTSASTLARAMRVPSVSSSRSKIAATSDTRGSADREHHEGASPREAHPGVERRDEDEQLGPAAGIPHGHPGDRGVGRHEGEELDAADGAGDLAELGGDRRAEVERDDEEDPGDRGDEVTLELGVEGGDDGHAQPEPGGHGKRRQPPHARPPLSVPASGRAQGRAQTSRVHRPPPRIRGQHTERADPRV